MLKLKLLVVGAKESGKTVLSNFLSEQSENIGGDYRPTQAVRILEFDVPNVRVKNRTGNVDVELWDCSGDHKYESCWAAMAKDTNGIVFVYNPDQPNQDKELESWHSYFTRTARLKDSQCVVISKADPDTLEKSISPIFSKIVSIKSNIEEDPDLVRHEFHKFVATVANAASERAEQEELNIMNRQ